MVKLVNSLQKATDYIGPLIIENDTLQFIQTAEGRVVPKTVDGVDKNEYQYHLKDHLGNVRTTFAVRDDDYSTSFETTSNPYFDNYDAITKLNNPLKRSGARAHRLTGGGTDIIGLMKTLYVSKGDKVSAEVYGKYLDTQFTDESVSGAALISALVGMLGGGTMTGEGTLVQNNLNTDFLSAALADGSEEQSPKAYLNYIMLDKNFNYLNSGFERLAESAADDGTGNAGHQKLSFEEIAIAEDGYLLVFLSNESQQQVEVFWDDFSVDHHYNAVLQADDYYPFGLTFNSYKREFSKKNKMNTFQDQEYDEETGWVQFKWRNHQPELGRFFNVDPLAEDYYYNSPYAFSENKVVAHIELEGLESYPINPSSNPLNYMAEGFRRMGDAALSLASATAEVFTNATQTVKEFAVGNTKTSVKSSTKTSAQVKFDFSDVMNYSGNNSFTAPDNMIEFGVFTTQSITESVTKTTKAGNVPVNTTLSSTQNATDKSVTNTAEVSVGVDNGNIQAKAFMNVSSTNNSDGSTSNKVSMGAKAEVPVFKDKGSTITVGSQVKLEHEF